MSIHAKLDRLSLDLHNVSQQSSPTTTKSHSNLPKKPSPVADSWEDETLSDEDLRSPLSDASIPLEAPGPNIKSPTTRAIDAEKELAGELDDLTTPPPTPLSPQSNSYKADWSPATALGGGRPTYSPSSTTSSMNNNASSTPRGTPLGSSTPIRYPTPDTSREKRPEKTTATANRLIAGALGIKAPPKTEEQRRYERAVKEQEIKKRNREKEERKRAEEDDERAKAAVWDA